MCVGLARVGRDDQLVISGTLGELATIDFGGPLHSLVIVGEMHELEREMLMEFHCSKIKDVKKISWATKFIKKEVKSNTKNNQKNTNDVVKAPASTFSAMNVAPSNNNNNNNSKTKKQEEKPVEEVPMQIKALIDDDSSSEEDN